MTIDELHSALRRLVETYTVTTDGGFSTHLSPSLDVHVEQGSYEAWRTVRRFLGLPTTPEEVAEQKEAEASLERISNYTANATLTLLEGGEQKED